ncbi:TIGR00303 family protein [Pleurocapsales cyanobacterium LEGE 06147]|nr:TIGR00303 family protein [Pleurocapsales cyanobacterium LEGE 06147]
MIYIYSQWQQGRRWLLRYQGRSPSFACILGFTATGLIPGISAAGSTPKAREYTAIADAEFLLEGPKATPQYPLPLLQDGVSPVFITRALLAALDLPVYLFNAGLPHSLSVPAIELGGIGARCLTSGEAMPLSKVQYLFQQGWQWGEKLAQTTDYLIIGECVVGGTTTALALLAGLGIEAAGKVNSSHPRCNHRQKWAVVQVGLERAGLLPVSQKVNPLAVVAAVGDPMQVVAAGMAIAASRFTGVMLAGGTQMLAVYALIEAITNYFSVRTELEQIVVGTTRWVAEDPTGDTVGLAQALVGGVPLLATGLSFATSRYPSLRAYEQGYVKEGVGAGGCAIAAHLMQGWTLTQLLTLIERLLANYRRLRLNSTSE